MTEPPSEQSATKLAGAFPAVSLDEWRAAAAKGQEAPELTTEVEDGIRVAWLYTPEDEIAPDPAGIPGRAPFERGTRAGRPWQIRQEHTHPDRAAANRNVLEDLNGGVTEITLRLDRAARHAYPPSSPAFADARGAEGVAVSTLDDLARVLDGVYLDMAPVSMSAGAQALPAAALLWALWQQNGIPDESAAGSFRIDPLGTLAGDGHLPGPPERELRLAAEAAAEASASLPGVTALAVDTGPYAEAGATPAWEMGIALSTAVQYLKACAEAGLGPAEAAAQIEFTLAVGPDQFLELAKFRAFRRLWARVLELSGVEEDRRSSRTYARTSWRMFAAVDPWVNMLRVTTATFAAGAGGADGVTVTPFDRPLGEPGKLGRRIARNTQLILQEESTLGRVADPAAGSWYVERLSDELARAGWERFRELEAGGGALEALTSGAIAEALGREADGRDDDLAHRRRSMTGVNEFPLLGEDGVLPDPVDLEALARTETGRLAERPDTPGLDALSSSAPGGRLRAAMKLATAGARIDELAAALSASGGEPAVLPPLAVRRDAGPFEHLRQAAVRHEQTGAERPRVFLACPGPIARHVNAANWGKSFFEVGGIETVPSGPLEDAAAHGRMLAAERLRMAAVCAGPKEEPESVAEVVAALRENGAEWVYLASPTAEQQEAAGADQTVSNGVDMIEVLGDALDRLGVEVD